MEKFYSKISAKNNSQIETAGLVLNSKKLTNHILDPKDPKIIYERLKFQDKPPMANRDQVIWLYNEAVISTEFLSYKKRPIFAEAFNLSKWNTQKFWFRLPLSFYWLIWVLGWSTKIGWTKKYVLELLKK